MLYAKVAALLVALVLGFTAGWRVQGWRWDAAAGEQARKAAEAVEAQRKRADDASAALEAAQAKDRAEFRVITREVDRVVEKPVYRNVCLDDDGLRVLQRAVDPAAAAASEPAATVR